MHDSEAKRDARAIKILACGSRGRYCPINVSQSVVSLKHHKMHSCEVDTTQFILGNSLKKMHNRQQIQILSSNISR